MLSFTRHVKHLCAHKIPWRPKATKIFSVDGPTKEKRTENENCSKIFSDYESLAGKVFAHITQAIFPNVRYEGEYFFKLDTQLHIVHTKNALNAF